MHNGSGAVGMNYTIGFGFGNCGAGDRVQHLQTKLFPLCTLQEKGSCQGLLSCVRSIWLENHKSIVFIFLHNYNHSRQTKKASLDSVAS